MDRVAPERSEKFMVPPRLEYWMVILNLKSVASVKRTRLAPNLFVDVITDRVYSDIEISSSNFIRTWNSIIIIFFLRNTSRNFETIFLFSRRNAKFRKKFARRQMASLLCPRTVSNSCILATQQATFPRSLIRRPCVNCRRSINTETLIESWLPLRCFITR